jgi:uncharacterized membrane protein
MESKARAFGHPIHPVLVVFPLGLFATSLVFDVIRFAGGSHEFSLAAFYMIGAGIVGGLAAAVFGIADFLHIPRRTRAKRIGWLHGIGNVTVTVLFVLSWTIRFADPAAFSLAAFGVSIVAVLLALVTGWLGGELVDRLGVGVDPGAHLDAPSSLSGRPATETWKGAQPRGAQPPLQPRRA